MGEATQWHGGNLSDVQNRPLNYIANIAGQAAVGCGMGAATDGSCQAGALAAGFSGAVGPAIMSATQSISDLNTRLAVGTALSGATGGAGSMLGGGKFENGAMTGAFGYLFNQAAEAYSKERAQARYQPILTEGNIDLDANAARASGMSAGEFYDAVKTVSCCRFRGQVVKLA